MAYKTEHQPYLGSQHYLILSEQRSRGGAHGIATFSTSSRLPTFHGGASLLSLSLFLRGCWRLCHQGAEPEAVGV
ncbi:hypothetical protein RIF29_27512 [Crotalaria pallida]|uniref:Uncharacterized protein n=1 Tax=Crotalaria pallida TaxID=3830 RepID=A0AAN9EPQ5_CROPI